MSGVNRGGVFGAAMERNIEEGTMSKGKNDNGRPVLQPAPAASAYSAAPGVIGDLHRLNVVYLIGPTEIEKEFFIQASPEVLADIVTTLKELGATYTARPLSLINPDVLKQALFISIPPQTKGTNAKAGKLVAPKAGFEDNGKRSVEGHKPARRSVRKQSSRRKRDNNVAPNLLGLAEAKSHD